MGYALEQPGDCDEDEQPAHRVQVSGFEVGKYEGMQQLWEAEIGQNSNHFRGCPQCPVEQVSWEDTRAFLRKLNALIGERYCLPTE